MNTNEDNSENCIVCNERCPPYECPIYGMASSEGVEKAQRGSNSKLIKPTVTVYISPEVAAQVTD